jgi:hypothetical protein
LDRRKTTARIAVLMIAMIISVFCLCSTVAAAPRYLPGETNDNPLMAQPGRGENTQPQDQSDLFPGEESEPETGGLSLEGIIVPDEPLMGEPLGSVLEEQEQPLLPQTGAKTCDTVTGSLLIFAGVIISQIRKRRAYCDLC